MYRAHQVAIGTRMQVDMILSVAIKHINNTKLVGVCGWDSWLASMPLATLSPDWYSQSSKRKVDTRWSVHILDETLAMRFPTPAVTHNSTSRSLYHWFIAVLHWSQSEILLKRRYVMPRNHWMRNTV